MQDPLHIEQDMQHQLDALISSMANNPVLVRAAAMAKATSDPDIESQKYAVDAQIEAYARLIDKDLQATPAYQRILDRSLKDFPDDLTMAVHELELQRDALAKLNETRARITGEPGLMAVLTRLEGDWPDDYNQQLHELLQQLEALEWLRGRRLNMPGDPGLVLLVQRAEREWPNDFSMQQHEVEQQSEALASLRQLTGNSNGRPIVRHASAQAEAEWPGDYVMQLHEVEESLANGQSSDQDERFSAALQGEESTGGTRMAEIVTTYSARGLPSFRLELWHDELHKHRVINGRDMDTMLRKAEQQAAQWNEQWTTTHLRTSARQRTEKNKGLAAQLTAATAAEQVGLRDLLRSSLERNPRLDWRSMQNHSAFPQSQPAAPIVTSFTPQNISQRRPEREDLTYQPNYGLLDWLMPSRRLSKQQACADRFAADERLWKESDTSNTHKNAADQERHSEAVAAMQQQHIAAIRAWEASRDAYLERQRDDNTAWDRQRSTYESADPTAVAAYCEMVLARSPYPDAFPNECAVDFQANGVLVMDLALPPPDAIGRLKEVRYVASREALEEKYLSSADHTKLYDDVLYQVVIRTISELFRADYIHAIKAIVLNGFVTSVDLATGHETTACILSVRAGSEQFAGLNLPQLDPKACFRQLKGVGSAKLHGLTPVAPILVLSREDRRFVDSHDVTHQLDQGTNLASMDWEEFEHLIREVFALEYAANGGEVRVTQASRDGGVDAVAFDPDPIRGGKIVIQAKRYTNTVPVSAVRDLFGTVQHEGAMKGILVTTSGFGPDALEFASNKPLSLIDGRQLLGLLAKHGHRAKIDLVEARRTMTQQRQFL